MLVIFLGEIIADHDLVAPGETSILDEHYGGPRPMPTRAVRPEDRGREGLLSRSGRRPRPSSRGRPPGASTSLKRRPRRAGPDGGGPRQRACSSPPLERAVAFGRFRAHDVRSIIAAGTGVPAPAAPGDALIVELPARRRPVRCRDYAIGERVMSTDTSRPARRPRGRAPSPPPRRHARAVTRTVGDGQDPALEARGVLAHLGRGRDRFA